MGLINNLINDPLGFIESMIYFIPAFLIGLCMHEWAHAYAAYRCGDSTAANLGRLSLNPARHLDPVGTLMIFFVGFGWAKPVPVNPRNFRNFKRDDIIVSLAGITMNLLLFVFFLLLSMLVNYYVWIPIVRSGASLSQMLSFSDGLINYILYDGGREFLENGFYARPYLVPLLRLFANIARTNLVLAVFNILPIPPLDGFHVFNDILFKGKIRITRQLSQIMMVAILVLSFSGLLGRYLFIAMEFIQGNLLKLFDLIL